VYFAVTLVVLVAIASPLVSMRLGQTDAGTLPSSSTQRRVYDLIAHAFGPGYNGPLKVAVDLPAGTPGSLPAHVAAAVKADPGIAAVSAPQLSASGTTAVLTAIPTTSPESAATTATVQGLRDHVLPAATAGTGATALVTGSTAGNIDLAHRVASRLALFIAAVVALSFLLLMMVFRSVWVPLKAAVMNGLSVGAGYGIVVAVFQWGWLKSVVGLRHTVPIESWVPMMMFAILFGLSMDYEVFLLSRVRERWEQTGDSRHSVVDGIARTGRVITSAALIMVSVFASFVLIDDPVLKMIGVGLAASVLVDATIIRMVLVPATMEMLGDANWWLPSWLDRLLPSIDLETSPPALVPTAEPAPA